MKTTKSLVTFLLGISLVGCSSKNEQSSSKQEIKDSYRFDNGYSLKNKDVPYFLTIQGIDAGTMDSRGIGKSNLQNKESLLKTCKKVDKNNDLYLNSLEIYLAYKNTKKDN